MGTTQSVVLFHNESNRMHVELISLIKQVKQILNSAVQNKLQRHHDLMTHSSPTIPEAASSRSSVKDTLFLSKAESEQMEGKRGDVAALGVEQ